MADFIETLTQYFAQFPGIGKRQARRMVYYLLRKNKTYTDGLIHQLEHLHDQLGLCSESYQFFYKEHPDETKAPIARNPDRDRTTIMIVEKDMDIEAMEMSRAYHGTYFVLGGLFPALETKYNPVRTDELIREITRRATEETLGEIIFALSVNPESEHTRMMLMQHLKPLAQKYEFSISQLGRGLSTGSELEYADGDTLAHALHKRS